MSLDDLSKSDLISIIRLLDVNICYKKWHPKQFKNSFTKQYTDFCYVSTGEYSDVQKYIYFTKNKMTDSEWEDLQNIKKENKKLKQNKTDLLQDKLKSIQHEIDSINESSDVDEDI